MHVCACNIGAITGSADALLVLGANCVRIMTKCNMYGFVRAGECVSGSVRCAC